MRIESAAADIGALEQLINGDLLEVFLVHYVQQGIFYRLLGLLDHSIVCAHK